MTKTRLLFTTALFLLLIAPAVATAELNVVTTTGDFAAMSRAILGDDGETINLVRATEDPHFVDPRPSFARHLNRADLVVFVGMDLEVGWLPSLISRARNRAIQDGQPGHFDASEHIQAREIPAGRVDRSQGDVHADGNPHYTTDPRQMARVAIAFGDALGELEPAKADEFRERSRDFAREAIRYAQRWEEKFAELPDESRQLVSYHRTMAYLSHWLDFDVPIELEPVPGVAPEPRHISRIIDLMESRNIGIIMQLDYYSTRTAESIADQRDATIIKAPAQTRDDESYFEHLDNLVTPLYEAMKERSE